jgi:hypothetical protein
MRRGIRSHKENEMAEQKSKERGQSPTRVIGLGRRRDRSEILFVADCRSRGNGLEGAAVNVNKNRIAIEAIRTFLIKVIFLAVIDIAILVNKTRKIRHDFQSNNRMLPLAD